MSIQKRTDLGKYIGELAIFFAVIFILIGFIGSTNWRDFGWQLSLTLAGAAMSVWITLTVIERAIREDRETQWEKVKSLTYMTILNNIRYMVSQFPETHAIKYEIINDHMEIINIDVNYPRKDVSDAIIGLAKDVNSIYKGRKEFSNDILVEAELSEEEYHVRDCEIRNLEHYCEEIGRILDDLRITLIPRVLQLSDDEEANLALLRFEAFSREFAEGQNGEGAPRCKLRGIHKELSCSFALSYSSCDLFLLRMLPNEQLPEYLLLLQPHLLSLCYEGEMRRVRHDDRSFFQGYQGCSLSTKPPYINPIKYSPDL